MGGGEVQQLKTPKADKDTQTHTPECETHSRNVAEGIDPR